MAHLSNGQQPSEGVENVNFPEKEPTDSPKEIQKIEGVGMNACKSQETVEQPRVRIQSPPGTKDLPTVDSSNASTNSINEKTDSGLTQYPQRPAMNSIPTEPLPPSQPELAGRGATMATTRSLPQLKRHETHMMQKHSHPLEHLGITLGGPMIILFDIVVPCIIYYTWYNSHKSQWVRDCNEQYGSVGACPISKPEFDKDILGYAIICFGFGELWILLARVWRLYFRQQECAPLLSRGRWELDATSWVYLTAMIVALIPFVVGSSLVLPHVYLYGPSCLMGFLGLLMAVTTFIPFKLPIGINSQPAGGHLRPFIYYAAEDFIAVDGLQDREFRQRYNDRYETNKAFRRMFLYLTIWWLFGVCVFVGCVSAVIWLCEFHIAFGLSLGVLFSYIAIWAATTYFYVKWEVAREHRLFDEGKDMA